MTNTQFVFCSAPHDLSRIHPIFHPEANELKKLGVNVGLKPDKEAEHLVLRSTILHSEEEYPTDSRFIQGWREYRSLSDLPIYFPLIKDISIPTFFVKNLSSDISKDILSRNWEKVFVKNASKSLWAINDNASVWPDTSFEEMSTMFESLFGKSDIYCIRKWVDLSKEERYWVMNGRIFHRSNKIPEIVMEAEKRLRVLGSKYYTIDASPEIIVEVNPGESSDRHGVNSPQLFASWLYESFCLN